jgi:hypothetical protein
MKTLALVLVLVATAFAQEAVVVELSPADAVAAKKAFEAKRAADKAWDDLYAKIQKAHASDGMAAGLQFSKDFRFVVPMFAGTGTVSVVGSGSNLFNGFQGTYTYPACQGSWTSPTSGTLRIDPPYSIGSSTTLLPMSVQ